MNGQIQYGTAHRMTSPATAEASPGGAELVPPREDLARRLGRFRHEFRRIERNPTKHDLSHVLDLVQTLGLTEADVHEELAEIRVALDAIEFREYVSRAGLPEVPSFGSLPAGERCYYVLPVRFGRRRSDQFGHLEVTSRWARFHGSSDVTVAWAQISAVDRKGRDIVLSMRDSRRQLRFGCHTLAEAARGVVIAQHLASHVGV